MKKTVLVFLIGFLFFLAACGGSVSLTLTSTSVADDSLSVSPAGELERNTEVTITAPTKSGSTFAHWYDTRAEEIFSEERVHTFTIAKSMELEAVYAANDHFGTPEGTVAYETGFEDATAKSGYAQGNMTSDGVDWLLVQVLRGNHDGDMKTGEYALRGRAIGKAEILEGFADLEGIVFDYAHGAFSGTGEGKLSVEISADGDSWVEIMAPRSPSTSLATIELLVDYNHPALRGASITKGDDIHVRFLFGGSDENEDNTTRINIDNVKVYRFAD